MGVKVDEHWYQSPFLADGCAAERVAGGRLTLQRTGRPNRDRGIFERPAFFEVIGWQLRKGRIRPCDGIGCLRAADSGPYSVIKISSGRNPLRKYRF
ncbi:hypothetical protein [Fumia xinanensis]|uniref:Uncharacterized protein n=1 Tax=Fumia xinanensis TaxID=2763659 RepID=A0A926I6S6_9FIRM|nr:hypothetical protein [Fumia xinanensis]MBC8560205.1 hypothetical protein [Fumia xinanensis]